MQSDRFYNLICCPEQGSQRFDLRKEEEEDRKWEVSGDRKRESSLDRVTQSLQASESVSIKLSKLRGKYKGVFNKISRQLLH